MVWTGARDRDVPGWAEACRMTAPYGTVTGAVYSAISRRDGSTVADLRQALPHLKAERVGNVAHGLLRRGLVTSDVIGPGGGMRGGRRVYRRADLLTETTDV